MNIAIRLEKCLLTIVWIVEYNMNIVSGMVVTLRLRS